MAAERLKRSEVQGRAGNSPALSRKPALAAPPEVKILHDTINEQVLIAAACVDEDARKRLVALVRSDGFFGKNHPEIWEVVSELDRRGLHYDPATMHQLGLEREQVAYLENVVSQRPASPPNLEHHLACFAWDQTRVEAARGPVAQLVEALRDVASDPELVRSIARNVATAFAGQGVLKYLRDQKQLLASMRKTIAKRREGFACFPFGFEGFDRFTAEDGELDGQWRVIPGLAPAQVSLVTGVPGSGKSTFVLRMLGNLARQQRRVLMGSWEMKSEYSLEVAGIVDGGFSRKDFSTGLVTDEIVAEHEQRCEAIGSWVRFMDLPFGRARGEKVLNERNLDLIHGYIAETGAEVAIFDLFRRAMKQRTPDDEDAALERLQAIAQETNTHICIVHQQRMKELETRPDKRPTRETIKGSGGWVEIPDTIVGVHSPGLWKRVDRETMELIMLKQRHGAWPWSTEHESDPSRGWIGPGRSIEYVRPDEATPIDSWIDGERSEDRQKKPKKAGERGQGSRKRANNY